MKQTRVHTKRYPAGRGAQRAITLVVFALALFVLSQVLRPKGGGDLAGNPVPILPVTPTPPPMTAQVTQAPTPVLDEVPKPGFPTPNAGREDNGSIFIPAQDWYAIQFGAYSNAESAAQQADLYTARGAAGYTLADDKYRVMAAVYPTREDADTIKARLKEAQGIDAYIYRLTTEEVELSVTAAEAQIQALRTGYAALQSTLEGMGRLSADLDKQVITGAQVLLDAQAMRQQVADSKKTLSDVLGSSTSTVVSGLRSLLDAADQGLETICMQNTQESVVMTSKIKYHQIDLLWRYIQYIRQITAQQA